MKKFTIFLFGACALSMLSGCKEEKPPEVVQTVDWYKTHKTERGEMLAKCQANPGELAATPNCVNASRAASSITWGAKGNSSMNQIKPLTFD